MTADPLEGPSTSLGTWKGLDHRDRWHWWEERWREAIELSERYRLTLRSGWWQDSLRVEAIAAFAAGIHAYDTQQENDPPGKLQLLATLDWLRGVLRGGQRAFDPLLDRPAFDQHLRLLGCRAPDQRPIPDPPANPEHQHHQGELAHELQAVKARLVELDQREQTLRAQLEHKPINGRGHARGDLALLQDTISRLRQRQDELDTRLHQRPKPHT